MTKKEMEGGFCKDPKATNPRVKDAVDKTK